MRLVLSIKQIVFKDVIMHELKSMQIHQAGWSNFQFAMETTLESFDSLIDGRVGVNNPPPVRAPQPGPAQPSQYSPAKLAKAVNHNSFRLCREQLKNWFTSRGPTEPANIVAYSNIIRFIPEILRTIPDTGQKSQY